MAKKIKVMSQDNKPISDEVQKEEIHVDKRFVKIVQPKRDKDEILVRNGRVYKRLDNQFGMYADTGEVFKI